MLKQLVLEVWIEKPRALTKIQANKAIYTFVAVNEQKKPVAVPLIEPETEQEIANYAAALRRKQLSLVLSGRMEAKDATELKALFFD